MEGENKPLVSIIIPVYNRVDLLPRTLNSVINQTYKDIEIIVVDDGSTEDIKSVVDNFNDPRIKYLRHNENKGVAAARNTGMKISRGAFIAFLDSDDEYLPEKIEKQVEFFLEQSNETDVVYCGVWRKGEDGKLSLWTPYISNWNFLVQQIMIKRSVIERVGLFYEEFIWVEDVDYMCRLKDTCKCKGFSEPLVIYNYEGNSITNTYKLPVLKFIELFIQKHYNRLSNKERSKWFYKLGQRYKRLHKISDAMRCFYKAYIEYPLNWKALKKLVGLSPLLLFYILKRN
ncbi:MAG: glycosyltransferase [Candidatus Omnitrophica bacterium]|nr:glycosyltransferase [Candidatus Omnitrophota bacterium]